MRDYWTCELCGANLDHGEKCDCEEQEIINSKHHSNLRNLYNKYRENENERKDYQFTYEYEPTRYGKSCFVDG